MGAPDRPAAPPPSSAPSSALLTGAQAVAEMLYERGYSTVFAYPGTSELSLCAALTSRHGIRLVNARGDKEAAFMAAGGNLVGPPTCAAILHGARGLTNALGAVADVRRSEVPALYLVGLPSRSSQRYLPPHGESALIEDAGAFAKAAIDCSAVRDLDARQFLSYVTAAFDAVQTGTPRGPVLLGLPQDLLTQRFVPGGTVISPAETAGQPESTTEREYARALALVRSADRPVVLVDDYLFGTSGAESELAALAASLSAPVLQVAYQRGPMLFQQVRADLVPQYLGRYDPTDELHRQLLASADLAVTVEDRNMYPRVVGPLPRCHKLALTSNPAATGKNGYLDSEDVLLAGDVATTMRRIVDDLERSRPVRAVPDAPRSWAQSGGAPHAAPIRPPVTYRDSAAELVCAVAHGLDGAPRPVIVDDSQMLGGLVVGNYHHLPAPIRVFGSHGGFVGGGLATAAGLALADPRLYVLVTLGDHGFVNGVQALAAIGEHKAPLVVLVCNNGTSVSLRKQAGFDGLGTAATSLGNPPQLSYAAVAEGFGLSATLVVWPSDLRRSAEVRAASRTLTAELRRAMAARRPHLVELMTPESPSFWAGVWRSEGLEGLPPPGEGDERWPASAAGQRRTPTGQVAG